MVQFSTLCRQTFRPFFVAVLAMFFVTISMLAQTANDQVPAYTGDFGQGMNFGWYENWTDEELAIISAGDAHSNVPGIGVNAVRPGLFAYFLESNGYDARVDAFKEYARLGMHDNVVIMGFPSDDQRSNEYWCNGSRSKLFKGMWEPIWDDNYGTPYNENNAYAEYMYKAVELYGDEVTFWEIWNEPDLNYSGNGWKDSSYDGNWFDNDPDPCEIEIQAPVQAYVRMLRISYEVVKRLQPNDYVAIGGIGYPSFLDAVLRLTDEKSSGAVTSQHPLGGGAYFDALSFHVYPHVDGAFREWDNDAGNWDYTRNSDVAVAGVENKWRGMDDVLHARGYNGATYPEKVRLCTESNLPRRAFNDENAKHASVEMQRNFMLKTLAKAQAWKLTQFHPYQLADNERSNNADYEYDLMGFYRFIDDTQDLTQVSPTQTGIAYRTYGELLRGARYSATLTNQLNLPGGADGVGYYLPSGKTAYLLWAKTMEDGNEYANINYALSGDLAGSRHRLVHYDYAVTREATAVHNTISLSGTPVFVIDASVLSGSVSDTDAVLLPQVALWPNPTDYSVTMKLPESTDVYAIDILDATGKVVLQHQALAGVSELLVERLAAGYYSLRATNAEQVYTTAFVKQ